MVSSVVLWALFSLSLSPLCRSSALETMTEYGGNEVPKNLVEHKSSLPKKDHDRFNGHTGKKVEIVQYCWRSISCCRDFTSQRTLHHLHRTSLSKPWLERLGPGWGGQRGQKRSHVG